MTRTVPQREEKWDREEKRTQQTLSKLSRLISKTSVPPLPNPRSTTGKHWQHKRSPSATAPQDAGSLGNTVCERIVSQTGIVFSFLKNAWLKTNLKSPGQCLCHAAPRLTVRRCPCVTRNPIFVSETDDFFRLIRLPSWIFTYVRCTDTLLGINPLYLQWMKYKNIHNVYKINLVVFLFFYRGKLFI